MLIIFSTKSFYINDNFNFLKLEVENIFYDIFEVKNG